MDYLFNNVDYWLLETAHLVTIMHFYTIFGVSRHNRFALYWCMFAVICSFTVNLRSMLFSVTICLNFKESDRKLIEERQSLLKTQKERTDLLTQCDIFENQIKELQRTNDNLQQDLGRITSDHEQLSAELRDEIDVLRNKLQRRSQNLSSIEYSI